MKIRFQLLLDIAIRHLFGGRFGYFLRARWLRWTTGLLAIAVGLAAGIILARAGHPVIGVLAGFGLLVGLWIVRILVHPPIPDIARGAYSTTVTFIAILGIALAVMTLIVVVSVMDGFAKDIQSAMLKTTPEVMVTDFDGKVSPALVDRILKVPGVTTAHPYVENDVLIKVEGVDRPVPVKLKGVTPDWTKARAELEVQEGKWQGLWDSGYVMIGSELARNYLIGPGDKIWIVSAQGIVTPLGMMPRMQELAVGGVFKTGFYEVDLSMIMTSVETAQKLTGLEGYVTGIDVFGKDPFLAPELARTIEREIPTPLLIRSWAELRKNLYEAMQTEKVAMFIIEMFLILIASFNITSTLFTAVARKTKEIGLLRAMGMGRRHIMAIFSMEGLFIGAFGTAIGVVFGVGFALYLKVFPVQMPGGGNVYYIDTVPVHISPWLIIAASVFSLILAVAASVVPSRQAAQLNPSQALRYE